MCKQDNLNEPRRGVLFYKYISSSGVHQDLIKVPCRYIESDNTQLHNHLIVAYIDTIKDSQRGDLATSLQKYICPFQYKLIKTSDSEPIKDNFIKGFPKQ